MVLKVYSVIGYDCDFNLRKYAIPVFNLLIFEFFFRFKHIVGINF
jgi:hypothetical protein